MAAKRTNARRRTTRVPPKANRQKSRPRSTVFRLVQRQPLSVAGKALRAGCPRSLLDPIEIASRDAITALQTRRLKRVLRHAYANVAHCRKKFEAAGVHPDDFKRLEDIAKFPFTGKDDLRATYPFGMFAVPRDKVLRIHASSGTTGKPTVVGYTANDLANWAALGARSIRAAGGRPGDIVHVAYGYGLFTGGLGAHYAAEQLGCTVIPMSGGQTERQVQLIQDFKPDIIMVTTSYMLAIGDEFARQGIDARRSSLKIGIHGAEPWTDAMRQEIEARFAIDAVDIYGLSEVMGPGVANECIETKDGPTIWEDHFYPEIIDPVTGAPVADGKTGELVFTTLTKEALPVIRYRTRDLSALLPGTARTMRRMARIAGRTDDMLIVRGVNVFPTQIEELILKDERLSPHYVIEVRREERLDELDVVVECKPDHAGKADIEADCAARLVQQIKSYIGISARVRPVAVGQVARSLGKAKRVIDLRPKD
ncbi:MAG: phenylacetate--CoA ligase [Proteobacteria bacterium]|nr:phenylacetate--CoA ligase [Pseudomonadota bacterium]